MGQGCILDTTQDSTPTSAAPATTGWEAYLDERDACVETTHQEYIAKGRDWDQSRINNAEYQCSTGELAYKYYATDPQGIIDLCVRTRYVSGYTREGGIEGSTTPEEAEFMEWVDNGDGTYSPGPEKFASWSKFCTTIIENNIKYFQD